MLKLEQPAALREIRNWIGGVAKAGTGEARNVVSPYFGQPIASFKESGQSDIEEAVALSKRAWTEWRKTTLAERSQLLQRLRGLILERAESLSISIALESGKTPAEARAGLLRGVDVIDFASSLSSLDLGGAADVSRGVRCEYRREPLGVVVGITPFNFPAMVPMWMFPLALVTGNTFVLKPSDKVPLTAFLLGELVHEAGFPAGVFSVINGGKASVEALVSHPETQAVAFVGSTPVAQGVYASAAAHGKRALCLGGAKNHMIVAPDADFELAAKSIFDSFTGCAGQRCMAGSVLLTIGEGRRVLDGIVRLAERAELGVTLGALINGAARERLHQAISEASAAGARVLVDGRTFEVPARFSGGNWLGPTIIAGVTDKMRCSTDELFGPVLSVLEVDSLEAALALEQQSPYGNATSVFTSSGAIARAVSEHASSGMIGINIGVPVPREPFSFGGSKKSKFGQGDITGAAGVEFWTQLKKITTKWAVQTDATWMS